MRKVGLKQFSRKDFLGLKIILVGFLVALSGGLLAVELDHTIVGNILFWGGWIVGFVGLMLHFAVMFRK